MQQERINTVRKGDFVKRTETAKTVYIKGDYCRATKRYSLIDTEDISREVFVRAGALVYVGFTY